MTFQKEILPTVCGMMGLMLHNVALVLLDGFEPFELGVVCEVFGADRTADGLPGYDFAVVAGEPGPLRSAVGFTLDTPFGLERLAQADLVVVSAVGDWRLPRCMAGDIAPGLLAALRGVVERGARVLSVCNGAFVLAAAGLLDGRRCTTHWRCTADLARLYPAAMVDPDVLYVDSDPVFTSAGSAAGIDACLYLVRREHGAKVANQIARRMVVPPHRDGGQAQFVDRPMSCEPGTLTEVIGWMDRHLDQQVTVAELASLAHMSPRTFARRFLQETGTTPLRWLTGQRILLAQQLLEETDDSVDRVAERAGFGNATAFRHHFRTWRGTTPHAYRRIFRAKGSHATAPGTAGE
jgi:transcriptional regulator GlxA family with amidase domain